MAQARKAVILSSGGLDSTTVMAMARDAGFILYSLSFRYGQRHVIELQAAEQVARVFDAQQHLVLPLDLAAIGGSSLTSEQPVPKDQPVDDPAQQIPSTYVPARNTIFLSYALAWAEVLGSRDIFLGVNAVDYSGYPDCRPEFVRAFTSLANVATRAGVSGDRFAIHAPLLEMTKADIIRTGTRLGVDYALTHSCYDPDDAGRACGHCDSCLLRRKGFYEAGVSDPTQYITE